MAWELLLSSIICYFSTKAFQKKHPLMSQVGSGGLHLDLISMNSVGVFLSLLGKMSCFLHSIVVQSEQ